MEDAINRRFKENYESVTQTKITRRIPTIIRIDGKAFSSLTQGLQKPYDVSFNVLMQETMLKLCEEIQNVALGYQQSDEISLLLIDYTTFETEQWFGGKVQKMTSVSAALATYFFNNILNKYNKNISAGCTVPTGICHLLMSEKIKVFDSRVFVVPKEEVANYFIARQKDATRNAIIGLAQTELGKKEILNQNCDELQDRLFKEKGINFNDLPTVQKRGACVRKFWQGYSLDTEIPIFTANRNYIEDLIEPKEKQNENT